MTAAIRPKAYKVDVLASPITAEGWQQAESGVVHLRRMMMVMDGVSSSAFLRLLISKTCFVDGLS